MAPAFEKLGGMPTARHPQNSPWDWVGRRMFLDAGRASRISAPTWVLCRAVPWRCRAVPCEFVVFQFAGHFDRTRNGSSPTSPASQTHPSLRVSEEGKTWSALDRAATDHPNQRQS